MMTKIYSLFYLLIIFGCSSTEEQQLKLNIIPLTIPVDASFRGLHAVNENIAWLSGSKGIYMRTVDGGVNWEYGSFLDSVDFRDIHAFDKDVAIMISAGIPAVIYKTEDGGKNWSLKYKNDDPRVFFDAIDFWDNLHGIAFSDSFEGRFFMITTSDGGNSWEQLPSAPVSIDGEGGFAASGTNMVVSGTSDIWIGTTTGRVIYSGDRGISWESFGSPLQNSENPTAGIFSVAISKGSGLLVGGDFQQPDNSENNVAILKNGSWEQPESGPMGFRSCVVFIPETSIAVSTGTSGTDISYDNGENWKSLDSIGYHTISFGKTASSGWMSGGRGLVAKIKVE